MIASVIDFIQGQNGALIASPLNCQKWDQHDFKLYAEAYKITYYLLPTGSEEREVLGVWSIPVAILSSS